jgi:methionine sulfoxide reductase heme-binding subunit
VSPRVAKPILFVLALAPALWLGYRTAVGDLGVNPVETLELTTGIWGLRLLLASLAITPVRRLTGWNGVIQYRRMLGLFAFFYASIHLLIYLVLDQGLEFRFILGDIAKRRFITAGMLAFLLMVPLALTSTKGWIRRLGRRWQALHRLVYASAILAALHFIWKVKVIIGEPVYYAAILAVLLSFRLAWRWRRGARAPGRQPARA